VRSAGIPVLAPSVSPELWRRGLSRLLQPHHRVRARPRQRQRPEVIETNKGVRSSTPGSGLVWRVCGARTRYSRRRPLREGNIQNFREAAIGSSRIHQSFELATLKAEQRRLSERLQRFGDCRDAPEIWRKAGLPEPERIAEITDDAFLAIPRIKGADHDAR